MDLNDIPKSYIFRSKPPRLKESNDVMVCLRILQILFFQTQCFKTRSDTLPQFPKFEKPDPLV